MVKRLTFSARFLAAVIVSILIGSPCVGAREQPSEQTSVVYFRTIAVAPFLVGHRQPNMDETLDDTLSCPLDQICMDDPTIKPDAGAMMMRLVHSVLNSRYSGHVVPLNDVRTAYDGLRLDGSKDSPRTLARRLGRRLSADLMLVGTVWRYREKGAIDGLPDKPASVAFALYLVEPESGRRLWRGIFDMAQEIAFQDMARFSSRIKMGLKWLSADELARHGVKEVFRPFPSNIQPVNEKGWK